MEEQKRSNEKLPDSYDVLFKQIESLNKVEDVKDILDLITKAMLEESRLDLQEKRQDDELMMQAIDSNGRSLLDKQTIMLKLGELQKAQEKTWNDWYAKYLAEIKNLIHQHNIASPLSKIFLDFWTNVYIAHDEYLHGYNIVSDKSKPAP